MIIRCAGCGWEPLPGSTFPFSCANRTAQPERDHVLHFEITPPADPIIDTSSRQPFVRYRNLLAVRTLAASDERYLDTVSRLDAAVHAVDGRGFEITPVAEHRELSNAIGCRVIVKDETGNVSGSHKARHLFGLAVALDLLEVPRTTALAIASCGNAALGAAVVAAAARRPLDVFVPVWADQNVVARLGDLGAHIHRCPRRDSDPPGDPCHHRFREAVAAGAVPFGCQGPDNGLTIDGGRTLGMELAEFGGHLDRVVVQVGGGALATSVGRGLASLGARPVLHAVQTAGCAPLVRAWDRAGDRPLAELAGHRADYMWPWETEPRSMATGILDDETYDWLSIVELMRDSGGSPVVVDETLVAEANQLARATTGIDVDATGTAGLAGLLALARAGRVGAAESVAVLFTGVRR